MYELQQYISQGPKDRGFRTFGGVTGCWYANRGVGMAKRSQKEKMDMQDRRSILIRTSTGKTVEVDSEYIHKIVRRTNGDPSGYVTIRIPDQQAVKIMELMLWQDSPR